MSLRRSTVRMTALAALVAFPMALSAGAASAAERSVPISSGGHSHLGADVIWGSGEIIWTSRDVIWGNLSWGVPVLTGVVELRSGSVPI